MNKKYVFIFGIGKEAKGVGAGFAHQFEHRGYEVVIQYRDEKKIPEILTEFPKAILFQSALTDASQLADELEKLKEKGVIPTIAVFSAGMPGTDSAVAPGLVGEEKEKKAIETYIAHNVVNKQVCFDACEKVYKDIQHRINIFVISSQAAKWDMETVRGYDEVGYHTAMVQVAEMAEAKKTIPYFDIEVLFTPSVETGGLQLLRDQVKKTGDDIAQGEDNAAYAENVLQKAGF